LIPLQTGVVTVDDVNVEYKYVKGRKSHSSLFEDDFFSFDNMFSDAFLDVDQKIVFLDPATVEVSALPEAPDNFSGAVGKFIISVKSRDKKVLQGKPLSIDVMISGVGNINAIDRPEFEEGNDYSLSFAGESTEKNEKGTKIGGNRKFEYILIAERPGEIKINPFFLTYFDTEKREYVRTGTESLVIDVEKDPDYTPMISEVGDFTDQSENSFNKKSGERSGSDIQYIMTHTSSSAIISKITLVLITLNILLIIYVILPPVGRKMGSFVISGKERIYRKTVKDLRASFEKGDFYSDFSNIFWKRAGLLLDLPPIKHTGREILDILKKKGMKEELIDRIRRFDEKINFIAFSGSEKSSERQDIDEAVALLSEIRRVS
jgi:hypothetical protein